MSRRARSFLASVPLLLIISLFSTGCVLAPAGTKSERARLDAAGAAYARPIDERSLPELSPEPGWRELLQRAFLANGDLEAAYLDWQAAVIRIDRAAGYPNTNLSLGYEYMFSGDNLKAWDRTTLSIGIDPMQNLSLPPKVYAAGRVALAEARAAGERFAAVKFDLQRRVLSAFLDYALLAELARLREVALALLDTAIASARSGVTVGGGQKQLLEVDAAARLARNDWLRLEAELAQATAMLNALVGREASAALQPPATLPEPRAVPDDARLLAFAVDNNPELAALAHDVRGRSEALKLARLQYLPDINPFAGITGSMEQFAGAVITFATTIPQIRASIAEARTMLQRGEAMTRQTKTERASEFVAALSSLRDAERQAAYLEKEVLPLVELRVANARQSYTAAGAPLADLIEGELAALELRALIAEQRVRREKKLAELEVLAGADVETLGQQWPPSISPPVTADGLRGRDEEGNAPIVGAFRTASQNFSPLRATCERGRYPIQNSSPVRAVCERGRIQEGAQ